MREQFNLIINNYKESVNENNKDLKALNRDELCQLVVQLREQLFTNTASLTLSPPPSYKSLEEENINNNQFLRDIFEQSRNQTELLEKITQNLSNPLDCKTIIKLSMAFLFTWTVKTHIIDAYLKR